MSILSTIQSIRDVVDKGIKTGTMITKDVISAGAGFFEPKDKQAKNEDTPRLTPKQEAQMQKEIEQALNQDVVEAEQVGGEANMWVMGKGMQTTQAEQSSPTQQTTNSLSRDTVNAAQQNATSFVDMVTAQGHGPKGAGSEISWASAVGGSRGEVKSFVEAHQSGTLAREGAGYAGLAQAA